MRIAVGPDDDPVALLRAAEGEAVVLEIAPGRDPLALALALAAVGPMAVERAPTMRVNAVVRLAGALDADVAAAVSYLESAWSTTGQVLEVG